MGGVEDEAGDVDEAGVVNAVQHGLVQAAQTPALDQIRNRRWAVDFDILTQGGSWRQAQPLTRT